MFYFHMRSFVPFVSSMHPNSWDSSGHPSSFRYVLGACGFLKLNFVTGSVREALLCVLLKGSITAYFMRASSIYSKLGLGFPHNFQETTYLKPTFCDNCAGFVSCSQSALGLNVGRGMRQFKVIKPGTDLMQLYQLFLPRAKANTHLQ